MPLLPLAQEVPPNALADFVDRLARTPLSQVVIFVVICSIVRLMIAPYLASTPKHLRSGAFTFARFGNEALDAMVYAGVFVFMLIRPFGVQAFKIPSGSMLETLQLNDFIAANKAIYRYSEPKHGDIIVFRPPTIACQPQQIDPDGQVNVDFIKRCIGLPGDTIEIRDNVLYRNGEKVNEPYLRERQDHDFKLVYYKGQYWPLLISGPMVNGDFYLTAKPFQLADTNEMNEVRALPPAKIPNGYLLMMGDNRNNSYDGRSWGLIPRSNVIGRSEFIWLPFNRWRRTITE